MSAVATMSSAPHASEGTSAVHFSLRHRSRTHNVSNAASTKATSAPSSRKASSRPSSSRSFSFLALKQAQATWQPSPLTYKNLPANVYDNILRNLEQSHLGLNSDGCLTCYLRDLHALSLTSRAWERVVRPKLYNKIHIHGPDSPAQLKKYKGKRGSRLRLLRRTLRERRPLANMVHELILPSFDSFSQSSAKWAGEDVHYDYIDLIASVVMSCPNLERLHGLALPFNHEFDRLTHALSTRRKLKQHAWIVSENHAATQELRGMSEEPVEKDFAFQFISYHDSWKHLETLMLHSLDSKGKLGHETYNHVFQNLPSLKHLYISCLLPSEFNDNNLESLPPLESLRLERLPGVTENGLSRLCSYQTTGCLKALVLIEQRISSLMLISKLLASLRELRTFAISQTKTSPTVPDGGMVLQPLLASNTLEFLHWDVKSPSASLALNDLSSRATIESLGRYNTPNSHLAQSILYSGFPALKTLRAPQDIDPLGALQCVCRPTPNGRIMIPEDRYSLPRSSRGSMPFNKRVQALPSGNHLSSARIRAQMLLEIATREIDSGMKIVVTDFSGPPQTAASDDSSCSGAGNSDNDDSSSISVAENALQPPALDAKSPSGIKVHEITVPLCMGRIGSGANANAAPIAPLYSLSPDASGQDADGGLLTWRHYANTNQTFEFLPSALPSPPTIDTNVRRSSRSSSFTGSINEPSSPTSPTSTANPFTRLASVANSSETSLDRSLRATSQVSSKKFPGTVSTPGQPYWLQDTCKGEWNKQHKGGKSWWEHTERERVPSKKSAGPLDLRVLFPRV